MRTKYRNRRTVVDGLAFASKREANYYQQLVSCRRARQCWFIRQPSFDLPGGVKYRADFLVVWIGGAKGQMVDVVDVKGIDTPISKLKRKQVEEIYGVQVRLT